MEFPLTWSKRIAVFEELLESMKKEVSTCFTCNLNSCREMLEIRLMVFRWLNNKKKVQRRALLSEIARPQSLYEPLSIFRQIAAHFQISTKCAANLDVPLLVDFATSLVSKGEIWSLQHRYTSEGYLWPLRHHRCTQQLTPYFACIYPWSSIWYFYLTRRPVSNSNARD